MDAIKLHQQAISLLFKIGTCKTSIECAKIDIDTYKYCEMSVKEKQAEERLNDLHKTSEDLAEHYQSIIKQLK